MERCNGIVDPELHDKWSTNDPVPTPTYCEWLHASPFGFAHSEVNQENIYTDSSLKTLSSCHPLNLTQNLYLGCACASRKARAPL